MMHTKGRSAICAWLLTGALAVAVPAGAQTYAYVANTNSSTVTVIETATGNTTTIEVGIAPSQVVISQDGARAFVVNTGSNSVSVIDTASQSVVDTIFVSDGPNSLAVTPAGDRIYVMGAAGLVEVFGTSTNERLASIFIGGSSGKLAMTPNGDRVYVASGSVSVIDTQSNEVVASFAPEVSSSPEVSNAAVDVAASPDGRVYVAVITYNFGWMGFSASGGLAVIEPGVDRVTQLIDLYSLPGSLALPADGSRVHVGIQAYWANTGYGAGFLPGRWIATIDAANGSIAWTDTGGAAPAGVGAAADGSIVFASLPASESVAEIHVATNAVTRFLPIGGGPTGVAFAPNPNARPRPPTVVARDDNPAPLLIPPPAAQVVVADVLANDTIGGAPARFDVVSLSLVSDASDVLALDTATGAVWIAAGAPAGDHSLTYQICDTANEANCGRGRVAVTVRRPFTLVAKADQASSFAGLRAIASVVANDTVDEAPASLETLTLAVVSGDPGIALNTSDGSVSVAAGAAPGPRALTYRICDAASAENCADAVVSVDVVRRPIAAGDDSGTAVTTGGIVVTNVLANDTFEGAGATLGKVTLAAVSSDAGVALNASGAVSVAPDTPAGVKTLVYQICETADAANCATATVTVTVSAAIITAAGEQVKASSVTASTPIRNVLSNDTIGGVRATLSNVTLSQVSISPSNTRIKLNADGSVSVGTRAGPGRYFLVYEICEIANPGNCAQASVRLDLSPRD